MPGYSKEDILREISRELNLDVVNLEKILEAKSKNLNLSYEEIEKLFFTLVETLEKAAGMADKL